MCANVKLKYWCKLVVLFNLIVWSSCGPSWEQLQLPEEHLPLCFSSNPAIAASCLHDASCPYEAAVKQAEGVCWGYEPYCNTASSGSHSSRGNSSSSSSSSSHSSTDSLSTTKYKNSYVQSHCPGHHRGWVQNRREQVELFFKQADFGYVQQHRDQLHPICASYTTPNPTHPTLGSSRPTTPNSGDSRDQSFLHCSDHLHFCRGRQVMLDLTRLASRKEPVRYHMDVLAPGDIQAYCRLDEAMLQRQIDQLSPLQSWAPELRNFRGTTTPPSQWRCDRTFDRPVIVVKIDAVVSLYHHFCDFFNLYASQHVNNTDEYAFSRDVQVLVWETFPYRSSFSQAWSVFTKHPLLTLADVAGQRLCFKEVMFPLLPRMIFGLYYNTPIVWGCERSGLFHAFNRHFLHRLGINTTTGGGGEEGVGGEDGKVRVLLLSRQTQHRRIINQAALVRAAQALPGVVFTLAEFSHAAPGGLKAQVGAVAKADVLVGMHGAGLTHTLFLPDWAAVFELYNCGDPHCYQDLARLRGVSYFTWEDPTKMVAEDEGHHPSLGAHEKFTNYQFDVAEFSRVLSKAVEAVRAHPLWRRRRLHTRAAGGGGGGDDEDDDGSSHYKQHNRNENKQFNKVEL